MNSFHFGALPRQLFQPYLGSIRRIACISNIGVTTPICLFFLEIDQSNGRFLLRLQLLRISFCKNRFILLIRNKFL